MCFKLLTLTQNSGKEGQMDFLISIYLDFSIIIHAITQYTLCQWFINLPLTQMSDNLMKDI